ncbi:MAG: hypothetical protein D6B25_06825 [Desulfobulbaceae bacterium]|nr:MAG: hypothetical protein D6B25_06825 [Desulfobulbaceae bacterium]
MVFSKPFIEKIPLEFHPKLPRSWDVIGDIAVTQVPSELRAYQEEIGREIMITNKRIRAVLNKTGTHSGSDRTVSLDHIAGDTTTETTHKEFGIRLLLDPCRVYFSIRTAHERKRIALQVKNDESVLVPFSGIAPYPLFIEKYSGAKMITGIEQNPVAHYYATENLRLNQAKNINLVNDDFSNVSDDYRGIFQRVIMPLPTRGIDYLTIVATLLGQKGILHLYLFINKDQIESMMDIIKGRLRACGRNVTKISTTVCGHPSPRLFKVCFDIEVEKDSKALFAKT